MASLATEARNNIAAGCSARNPPSKQPAPYEAMNVRRRLRGKLPLSRSRGSFKVEI